MNSPQLLFRKKPSPEFVRFVLSGLINTVSTYLLFAVLSTFMHYNLAYTLVYVVGVFMSYILNTRFVFRIAKHWKSLLAYPLVYILQYGVGIILLPILIEIFKLDRLIAAPLVILASLPLTFIASRLVIKLGGKS